MKLFTGRRLSTGIGGGDFPEPQELLGKDFPETSNVYSLLPVCARIALQVTGELPRVVSRKMPMFLPVLMP